jgi:hypothetical protein
MHGGHQGAKKSIKTGSPLVMISGKSPVASVRRVRACIDSRANAATSCIRSRFRSTNNDSRKQRQEGPKNELAPRPYTESRANAANPMKCTTNLCKCLTC